MEATNQGKKFCESCNKYLLAKNMERHLKSATHIKNVNKFVEIDEET
jgi:hypothetical protein